MVREDKRGIGVGSYLLVKLINKLSSSMLRSRKTNKLFIKERDQGHLYRRRMSSWLRDSMRWSRHIKNRILTSLRNQLIMRVLGSM